MKVYEVITPINEEFSLNPFKWGAKPTTGQLRSAAADIKAGTPVWAAKLGVKRLANKQAEAAVAERMGPAIGAIAKLAGFFYITVDLYQNLDELERAYNEGKVKSDWYKQAHEAYIGMWMVQLMVPWLTRILQVQRIVSILVRVVLAIATLGATAVTGGALAPAALAGVVVEQAVFLGVQGFLTSETFKNWAKDYMVAFATVGYVPDELYNQLRAYISKIPGVDKIMKNPGDTFYQSQDKNRPADVRAKDDSKADTTPGGASLLKDLRDDPANIVINGALVGNTKTGEIDKLMVASPTVQSQIKLHPEDPQVQKYLKLAGK